MRARVQIPLTPPQINRRLGGFSIPGELSERFKEPVLKTGDSERNLGFESLTLRQIRTVIRIRSYPDYGSFLR